MNYSENSSKKKGNTAFYIILIVCLVIIGIAAWFAFSNMGNNTPNTESDMQNSEYNNDNSSYNKNEDDIGNNIDDGADNMIANEPTADEVEDVPYTGPVSEKAYTMPVNGDILKDFSTSTLQYSATYGDMRIHSAVDISCKENTIVSACTDGTVQSIEKSATLGNTVTIDHGDGLVIKYAALNNVTLKSGDSVKCGEKLGTVTTVPSECEDQSHLHIEVFKDGKSISILSLFQE